MGFQKDQGLLAASPLISRHVAVFSNRFTDDNIGFNIDFTQDCKTYKRYVCSIKATYWRMQSGKLGHDFLATNKQKG